MQQKCLRLVVLLSLARKSRLRPPLPSRPNAGGSPRRRPRRRTQARQTQCAAGKKWLYGCGSLQPQDAAV
eukprot:8227084-Pyramimonas_sp.AAC.1